MRIFPQKNQFKRWSMPSKITYISFWIAVIGIVYAVFLHFTNNSASKEDLNNLPQKEDLKEIRDILLADMAEIQRQREDEFLKYYDIGYQLVAFDRFNNVIPYNSRLRFDIKIDWESTKIELQNSDLVILYLPKIIDLKSNSTYTQNGVEFPFGYIGKIHMVTIDNFKLAVEGIDYNYYGYICLIGLKSYIF